MRSGNDESPRHLLCSGISKSQRSLAVPLLTKAFLKKIDTLDSKVNGKSAELLFKIRNKLFVPISQFPKRIGKDPLGKPCSWTNVLSAWCTSAWRNISDNYITGCHYINQGTSAVKLLPRVIWTNESSIVSRRHTEVRNKEREEE